MLRRPATPIPPVEPTRREARVMVAADPASCVLVAASRWVSILALASLPLVVWEVRTRRAVVRRVEPDAGWGRTAYSLFDRRTATRTVLATGWPPALVRAVQGAAFVGFFATAVWSLWR